MKRLSNLAGNVVRDPTAQTLLLAAGILALVAVCRPQEKSGLPIDVFWYEKVHFRQSADCVLGGDSRIMCGASPAVIADALPGFRVKNFAFSGCGYSPDYLNQLRDVLHPSSSQPIIVLGVSPGSLTRMAVERKSGFSAEMARRSQPRPRPSWLADAIQNRLRPIPLRQIAGFLRDPWTKTGYFQEHHADGWIASQRVPRSPTLTVPWYRQHFRENQVCPAVLADLLTATREWSSGGIRVYAVRMPISAELKAVEDELAGFDEAAFVARFEAAGGRWLPLNQDGYVTGDGSHLERESAVRFSQWLAEVIREDLQTDSLFTQRLPASRMRLNAPVDAAENVPISRR